MDLSHLDTGLGGRSGELFVAAPHPHNLACPRLRRRGQVKVPVSRLDDLAITGPVSLMKVDVEGMELDVLAGAADLITRHRPVLAIEVDTEHTGDFWTWTGEHGYQVIGASRPYPANVNHLCIPTGPLPQVDRHRSS